MRHLTLKNCKATNLFLQVKESKLREAEVKKDAMASKVGDLEMASQVRKEKGREHLLKQFMYHVWVCVHHLVRLKRSSC